MVPLIMSLSREDNPSSAFEEFGTHLSLYDDSFHFVEKPVPPTSSPLPAVEDSKGSLPPSVFYPLSKNAEDVSGQVKVKRKCGRPRNPIPRHKRESHINAEHRRRGKIQDGFRTLKGIVPKYEQSSGRDSKADILFKAVDYCKLLQNDIRELGSSIEALRAEKDAISVDIKNYKTVVPDLSLYDDMSVSLDDRYTDYIQAKSKEHWSFGTFKVIMRPLFESYKLCVRGESLGEFLRSVADWAANSLSLPNLRTVCLTTLRDDTARFAEVDQVKVGNSINSYGAASPTAKAALTDSNNNNRCLESQSLTSELFGYHNIVASTDRSGWNQTSEIQNHSFGNTQMTTNRSSPIRQRGLLFNMQSCEDLVSFAGGNMEGSNVFGDLYYNLGSDLHHQQLNVARASMNHWPNLHFRQQRGHYFQNNHLPSSRHCSDFRESQHFLESQHQQLSQHLIRDHNLASGHYQQQTYQLPEREFRYDLSSSREGLETLPASVPYLCHSTNILDPDLYRRKRLSQSSSGSEGSLLNMDLFARKASETLGELEKHSQLSPSTDSCVSSGSSAYIPSPGILNGRNADFSCSYRSASSLDNFRQGQPVSFDRIVSLDNQMALFSSTYRDVFGVGPSEQQTNCVNNLGECQKSSVNRLDERLKTSVNRHDRDVRLGVCATNTAKTVGAAGCRQPSLSAQDSSPLLAEMLDQQQAALHQSWSAHNCMDTMQPPPTQPHNVINTHLSTPPTPNKSADFVNELVTKSSAYIQSSLPPGRNLDYPYTAGKDQLSPLSTKAQPSSSFRFHSNEIQKNLSSLDVKNPVVSNSSWLHPFAESQTTPGFNASTKLKLDRNQRLNGSPNQSSYFDMAQQKLLQNHFYSIHKKDNELPDQIKPPKDSGSIPKEGTEIFFRKTAPVSNTEAPTSAPAQSSEFLEKSSQLNLQPQTCSAFVEAPLKHKVGRKSPFGGGCPEDDELDAVSANKKACQRQSSLKISPRMLMAARQFGDSETVTEI